ncbi:pyridoxamine phosphate oxidase family protein [Pseudovirgaria hyperparasitica]|uniref:Pyridoxamine phosphate oxidase family protein n=1 Tax=Pseudovirgaria hyperparasitica TaxID=470096 RepID=A0A6A6W3C0_9PEZI|nr:pyridoxamine phosphate oxidase family protein [Pseudovirgaria hyperparasitica]KAF2757065.1 pyridoxamine phosphate oxidase family protein [Pseudovirgaria hyperparasitica]
MGAFFQTIPKNLISWILEQKVFWIGSAPLSGDGHINVSPKGGMYFGVIDEKTFWYCDLTGSGVETTSHLHEPGNGRICVLFNAFDGPPRIVRLWGKGNVLEYGSSEFKAFVAKHDVKTIPGVRSIIVVDIHQVGSSCGFSVPTYNFKDFRTTLNEFAEKRLKSDEEGNTKDGMERYWAHKNAYSMDGLPGLQRGYQTLVRDKVAPIKKMVGPYAPTAPRRPPRGVHPVWLIIVAMFSFIVGILMPVWFPVSQRMVWKRGV